MSIMEVSEQVSHVLPNVPMGGGAGIQRMGTGQSEAAPTATELRQIIEVEAYYRAQSRQFLPGHELDDWLAAENEVCARYGVCREDAPSR